MRDRRAGVADVHEIAAMSDVTELIQDASLSRASWRRAGRWLAEQQR